MTTRVIFKRGSITIEEDSGEVFLSIDKDVVPLVHIRAKDSGLPGVVGPDIPIKLKDVVEEVNNEALTRAFPDALS